MFVYFSTLSVLVKARPNIFFSSEYTSNNSLNNYHIKISLKHFFLVQKVFFRYQTRYRIGIAIPKEQVDWTVL